MQCTAPEPRDLLAALMPNQSYWQNLQSQVEDLDRTLSMYANQPMVQHTYGSVHGRNWREMVIDLRSAAGLLNANVFTSAEVDAFIELGMAEYVNPGLALAARYLRPRAPTIPDQILVQTVRTTAFSFVLRLIGEDLKEPRPVLQNLITRFEMEEREKMSLLQAALINCANQSKKIVHH